MLRREAMDLRANNTQVREGREVEGERRVDREEGGLGDLNTIVVKKAKRKLERDCKGGACITFFTPRSQDGTDIYMKYFRVTLMWCIDLPLQNTPMACDGCINPLMVDHV